MFSRRSFLAVSTSATLLGAGCKNAAEGVSAASGKISKVGIQTYTLREMFAQDPMATFKMIKEAGYDYVELNGRNFQQVPVGKLKAMLDEVGLTAPATHISLDMLKGDMSELMQVSKTLGMEYLTVPYIADDARSLENWKSHANLMNEAGEKLRDNGFKLAYHNHQFEFDDLGGGTTAMDILMNDTVPENLWFQLDMFWANLVDIDIPALFKQYSGRFKLCHIKDMKANKADFQDAEYEDITTNLMVDVGEGIIDFESYFALNNVSGMEYFIAEHDNPKKPYAQAITTSLNTIKAMRF